MKDLVSVIIPVYNCEKYIEKCLNSIINQTYENIEIIVIDDGSKDNTKSICENIANKDNRVVFIHKENGGVSSARNAGLDVAKGKYVIFVDADDYIEKNMIEILYNEIERNDIDIVSCGLYEENGISQKKVIPNCKEILNQEDLYKELLNFENGITAYPVNKIYKNQIIKEYHLRFKEEFSIGEDMIFCSEYIDFCQKGKIVKEPLYHYYRVEQSATKSKITEKYIHSILGSYQFILEKYKDLKLNEKTISYVKEKYIDTFKGCQTRAIETKFENKDIIKKYSKISKAYFRDIKKYLSKEKILRNYISLYFPKFYLMLFKVKHMKIKKRNANIITIIGNNNYGNRLQNYAVQEFCKKNNLNPITIKNNVISNKKENSQIKNILRYLKANVYEFKEKLSNRSVRAKRFNEFNKNIKFSRTLFSNIKILNNYKDEDIFLVGSDQVWNPKFERLRAFDLLEFTEKGKKIAFSASFGISELPKENEKNAQIAFEKFKAISVREDAGKNIIKKLTNREDVEVIVDPTMLLTTEEWDKVAKRPEQLGDKKYILNYFLGELPKERKEEIDRIANKYDCEVINILDKNSHFYQTGPSEFLYLEKNAFLVCTDSFHSCVFAILYNTPFVVFDRTENITSMNSRIETLLSKFKLENRYLKKEKILDELLSSNYEESYKILEIERENAKQFLLKAIN